MKFNKNEYRAGHLRRTFDNIWDSPKLREKARRIGERYDVRWTQVVEMMAKYIMGEPVPTYYENEENALIAIEGLFNESYSLHGRTLREWTMRDGDVDWEDFDKFTNYKKYLPISGEGDTKASQMATAVSKIVYRYFNDGDTIRRAPGWGNKQNMTGLVRWLKRYVPELRDILTGYPKNEGPMYERFLYDLAATMDEIIDDYADEPKAGTIYEE